MPRTPVGSSRAATCWKLDQLRIDIVERVAETVGGTEIIELPSPVTGVAFAPARMLAVDVAQHAAEKFHALCRTYSGERPNTRVKDLVDVLLLHDAGLLPDPRLGSRVGAVFESRDGLSPPSDLPEPPAAWDRDYTALTAETPVSAVTVGDAIMIAGRLYRQSLS